MSAYEQKRHSEAFKTQVIEEVYSVLEKFAFFSVSRRIDRCNPISF